jgi:hypothetical protein
VASASATHAVTRRRLLAGTLATASAALTVAAVPADALPPAVIKPDADLIELERTFHEALDAYEAARQHYNRCEDRYFDLRPCVPKALTGDGPLGHLLFDESSHWRAADLRRMLKNSEHQDVWEAVRAALTIAKAYEKEVRRAKRETQVIAAEAAHNAAIDALGEVGMLILDAPARSLVGLAVKARVVKTWGKPDWWDPIEGRADTYERLAAQILDAVVAMVDGQLKRRAG